MRYFALVLSNRTSNHHGDRGRPRHLGDHLPRHHRTPATGPPLLAAVVRALPAGLVLVVLTRRLPRGDVVVARSRARRPQHRGVLRAAVRRRVPAARRGGRDHRRGAAPPGRRPLRRICSASGCPCAPRSPPPRVWPVSACSSCGRTRGWTASASPPRPGARSSWPLGVVLSKRWPSPAPLLATTGWQLTAGGLLLLPVALLVEGPPPATLSVTNLAGYGYLAIIGSALAYALWFRGIRDLSATGVTFLGLLSPLVATSLGWLVLGQNSRSPRPWAVSSSSPPSSCRTCPRPRPTTAAPPTHPTHRGTAPASPGRPTAVAAGPAGPAASGEPAVRGRRSPAARRRRGPGRAGRPGGGSTASSSQSAATRTRLPGIDEQVVAAGDGLGRRARTAARAAGSAAASDRRGRRRSRGRGAGTAGAAPCP